MVFRSSISLLIFCLLGLSITDRCLPKSLILALCPHTILISSRNPHMLKEGPGGRQSNRGGRLSPCYSHSRVLMRSGCLQVCSTSPFTLSSSRSSHVGHCLLPWFCKFSKVSPTMLPVQPIELGVNCVFIAVWELCLYTVSSYNGGFVSLSLKECQFFWVTCFDAFY